LARYNVDGSLDPTFSEDGKQVIGFGPLDRGIAAALAVQPNGKIVAAGYSPTAFEFGLVVDVQIPVARFNGDGSLDPSFGSGGKVLTRVVLAAMAIDPRGKLLTTGDPFGVARYNGDGSLDQRFGSGGSVLTDFGPGSSSHAEAIAIQPNGA